MIRTIVRHVEILGPGPGYGIEVSDGHTWARAVLDFDELEGEHVLDILVSPDLNADQAPYFANRRFHVSPGSEDEVRSSIETHLSQIRAPTMEELFVELDQRGFDAS